MKERLKALAEAIALKRQAAEDLLAKEDATAEDIETAAGLTADAEALQKQHNLLAKNVAMDEWLSQTATKAPPVPAVSAPPAPALPTVPQRQTDFARPRIKSVTSFKDADGMSAEERAYRFGRFISAAMTTDPASTKWCEQHGVALKAQSESVNTAGGFLVPTEFVNDLIDLREQYGTFRRRANPRRMGRDVMQIPRRTSSVTAYWVGEGEAATASQKAWDMVDVTAKKLAAIVLYSSELSEDAFIDVGNDLAQEIAWQFAYKEDAAGFLGDGTSTYGRIEGLDARFKRTVTDAGGTWTTDAHKIYNPSIVAATGNAWSEITAGDIAKVAGAVLSTTGDTNMAWFCHRVFYYNVMVALELAAGGNTRSDLRAGQVPTFLGYPVEFVQLLPKAESNDTIPLFFGDLAAAVTFGDRREVTLARSDQYKWAEDQLAIKGTERLDINVHDVGTANSSAASREYGPMSCLALLHA